jgi:hypothetical protein
MNHNIHVHECNGSSHDSPTLLPQHLADLRASGLSDDTIRRCGFHSVITPGQVTRLLRWRGRAKSLGACLAIPFSQAPGYVRLKPDNPRRDRRGKAVKYESPVGRPNRAYFPPGTAAVLADATVPLVITEGEKKAAKADQEGFPCIGLVGVYGWQKPRGAAAPRGDRYLIDDLAGVAWRGRAVYVVYDSDAAENPAVWQAALHLAEALADDGADARIAFVPSGVPGPDGRAVKMGLDDYLVAHGPDALRAVLAGAKRADELPPPPRPRAAVGTDGAAVMGERLDLDDLDSDAARRAAREAAEEAAADAEASRVANENYHAQFSGFGCKKSYGLLMYDLAGDRDFVMRLRCNNWECSGCRSLFKYQWTNNVKLRLGLLERSDPGSFVYVARVSRQEWESKYRRRCNRAGGEAFTFAAVGGETLDVYCTADVFCGRCERISPAEATRRLTGAIESFHGQRCPMTATAGWRMPKHERPAKTRFECAGKLDASATQERVEEVADVVGVRITSGANENSATSRITATFGIAYPKGWTAYQCNWFRSLLLFGTAPDGTDIEYVTEPPPPRPPDPLEDLETEYDDCRVKLGEGLDLCSV